jgi:hypothetical protein
MYFIKLLYLVKQRRTSAHTPVSFRLHPISETMNSSAIANTRTTRLPRRISCGSGLDRIDPPLFITRPHLIDYSAFRAAVDESNHGGSKKAEGRKLGSATSNGKQHEQRRQRSTSYSLLAGKQAPAISAASNNDALEDESTESDVVFTMKVTKPSRLFRRRRTLHTGTVITVSEACSTTLEFAASPRHGSSYSFCDETMTLNSMAALRAEENPEDGIATPGAAVPLEMPTPPKETIPVQGDGANYNAQASAEFTCMAVANHDSFQSAASDFVGPKATHDLRKKRKSMMNWLANQIPSHNLLAPPNLEDIRPPACVKVIYLPEDHHANNK